MESSRPGSTHPDLIGRRSAWQAIRAAYAAARRGRMAIVLCTGEPGIGKTHLLDVAARRLEPRLPWSATMRRSMTCRQKRMLIPVLLIVAGEGLAACGTSPVSPQAPPTSSPLLPTPSASPTLPPVTPGPSPTPVPLPLSEPGPYFTGRRTFTAVDAARGGREVKIDVWYPAIQPEGYTGTVAVDAPPDPSGAPYPLILSSSVVARIFAVQLVSYGFAWASVQGINTYWAMNEEMYQQPLDILFALDQVAENPPEGLEGILDADHAGATGYSFDGYNTLAMSGARIDPAYYLAQCPTPDAITQSILLSLSAYNCAPAERWEEFEAGAGESITASPDGLWQPLTDPRIRAVMPMAGEGWWLFGEKGLAAVDRPVLMLAGTLDTLYPENVLIFQHLGDIEKTFLSFVGQEHMMVTDPAQARRMAHFAVAFFGVHLQGNEDLRRYYSEEWVRQYEDLAWGPMPAR